METRPQRRPARLAGYDYSRAGVYFLTICTKGRICCLSEIRPVGGGALDAPRVMLRPWGVIVEEWIEECRKAYSYMSVEKYVIMPNHIHILLSLRDGPSRAPAPTRRRANETIPQFVSALKRMTAKRCGQALWQEGYHDHIVRDDEDFLRIWQYIHTNPAKWAQDEYYIP